MKYHAEKKQTFVEFLKKHMIKGLMKNKGHDVIKHTYDSQHIELHIC